MDSTSHDGNARQPSIVLTGLEAAEYTKLSLKTLERNAAAGEPLGRVKIGRRVIYIREALTKWIESKIQNPNTPTI